MEKTRRSSSGGNRSRTMAREITDPPHAATACRSLNAAIAGIEGERAHAADDAMKIARLTYIGGLRPKRSVIGPYRDWPRANPSRNVTIVLWTAAADV